MLLTAARTGPFWLLAGTFAICGASTNGLIQTHFVPAAHDHGMPITAAASLLAVIGVFDVVGTIASGWFTDRFDARRLLAVYYALRGISLLFLPMLLAPDRAPADGLLHRLLRPRLGRHGPADRSPCAASSTARTARSSSAGCWPPTRSARRSSPSSAASRGTSFGSYDVVWYASGALCAAAALMALVIRRRPAGVAALRRPAWLRRPEPAAAVGRQWRSVPRGRTGRGQRPRWKSSGSPSAAAPRACTLPTTIRWSPPVWTAWTVQSTQAGTARAAVTR